MGKLITASLVGFNIACAILQFSLGNYGWGVFSTLVAAFCAAVVWMDNR